MAAVAQRTAQQYVALQRAAGEQQAPGESALIGLLETGLQPPRSDWPTR